MTEKQALTYASKLLRGKATQVTSYKNFYIFTASIRNGSLENPIAVDKETGKTFVFHPMKNDPEAYFKAVRENGHLISDSAYNQKVTAGKKAIAHSLMKAR